MEQKITQEARKSVVGALSTPRLRKSEVALLLIPLILTKLDAHPPERGTKVQTEKSHCLTGNEPQPDNTRPELPAACLDGKWVVIASSKGPHS